MARKKSKPNPKASGSDQVTNSTATGGKAGAQRGKNFQKGQTRHNSTKAQRREAEDLDGEQKSDKIKLSTSNPFSFYSNYPQLVEDAGKVSFANPVGKNLKSVCPSLVKWGNLKVPGVMRIGFYPAYGYSDSKNSPLNRSADAFFTYMRSELRTNGNYDSTDQMIVLIALDNLFMWHRLLVRLYGTSDLYPPVNYAYPRKLVEAQGFDPDEFCKPEVRYELREHINGLAATLSRYTLLDNVDIFKRHEWMVSGLYTDSDTTKAQTYVFAPEGLWIYDNLAEVGSTLKWLAFPSTTESSELSTVKHPRFHTMTEVKTYTNSMLTALMGDADVSDVCGDLLHAFGANAMVHLQFIDPAFVTIPVYSESVLSQIENATFMGYWAEGYTPVITQDPSINVGCLIFKPQFTPMLSFGRDNRNYVGAENRILNLHKDNPTVEDVIEATRLTAMSTGYPAGAQTNCYLSVFGSDIASAWSIYYDNDPGEGFDTHILGQVHGMNNISYFVTLPAGAYTNEFGRSIETQAMLSAFDWSPICNVTLDNGNGVYTMGWIFDIDNVALLSESVLEQMHATCLMSMFKIPELSFLK